MRKTSLEAPAVSFAVTEWTRKAEREFYYVISGLQVRSEIELPSAFLQGDRQQSAEIRIQQGAVPTHLPNADAIGPDWEQSGKAFLLRVAGIAIFLVENGTSIRFESFPNADPGDITLYLLGTCLAILLQQRGSLVLHASSVAVGSQAVLFCGQSGSGKSTMAAILCQRGYPLLNDDTCNVSLSEDGRPIVSADGRMLKLWSASLNYVAPGREAPAVRNNTDKYYLEPQRSDASPRQIAAIYVLSDKNSGETPSLKKLTTLESLCCLKANAYKPELVQIMGLNEEYFQVSAALQRYAPIYTLTRSKHFEQTNAVVATLEHHWRTNLRQDEKS